MTYRGEAVKRFGLIGDPVRHSLSPVMHRAAFRELGLEAEYRLCHVPADRPDEVRSMVVSLASSGGGNVTLPHKQAAAAVLDVASDDVVLTGACNCFWADELGRIQGDNTDVGGIISVLRSMPGLDPSGALVLVLGAGGAARAAVVAAIRAGAAEVRVFNRSPDRAAGLIDELRPAIAGEALDPEGGVSGDASRTRLELARAPVEAGELDLVIQATRLGLHTRDPLPLELADNPPAYALDLVYAPGETRWTKHARECGAEARDGLSVLLEQGILSLERWLDRPMPGAVRDAMRESLAIAAG